MTTKENRFKFTGKEAQPETGWIDFGARMYQPDLGRWFVKDPLAEIYEGYSPYNYVLNNPIRLIDPNGMAVTETDTSVVYTGQDAVDKFKELKANSSGDSGGGSEEALQGVPVITALTAEVAEKEGWKFILGRTTGWILSLAFLNGDTSPTDIYTPQWAEEAVNKLISEGNLVALKEYVEEYNKRNPDPIVFRYLSAKEGMFIGKTMVIRNTDQNLNLTRKYVTPDVYGSRSTAKSRLALPYAPQIAVWTFQSQIQATKRPGFSWNIVEPAFGENGGGREATISQPFPVKGGFILGK